MSNLCLVAPPPTRPMLEAKPVRRAFPTAKARRPTPCSPGARDSGHRAPYLGAAWPRRWLRRSSGSPSARPRTRIDISIASKRSRICFRPLQPRRRPSDGRGTNRCASSVCGKSRADDRQRTMRWLSWGRLFFEGSQTALATPGKKTPSRKEASGSLNLIGSLGGGVEPIDILRSGRRCCALTVQKINHPPSLSSTLGYRAALRKAQPMESCRACWRQQSSKMLGLRCACAASIRSRVIRRPGAKARQPPQPNPAGPSIGSTAPTMHFCTTEATSFDPCRATHRRERELLPPCTVA